MAVPLKFATNKKINDLWIKLFLVHAILLLFTFYNFLFLDLLGIRDIVQTWLLIIVFMLSFIIIFFRKIHKRPDDISLLFIIILSVNILFAAILRSSFGEISNLAVGLIFVLVFYQINDSQKEFAIKTFISIIFYFAVLGIFQFLLLILFPEYRHFTQLFIDDIYKSTTSLVNHWIILLGLTDASGSIISFWGVQISRMKSFLNEPSLAVAYFLLPAGLAFSYKKSYKGFFIFTFALLTFSGSIFGCLFISLVIIAIYYITKNKYILLLLPIIIFLLLLILIFQGKLGVIMSFINSPAELLGMDIFNKGDETGGSGFPRFYSMYDAIMEIESNLFLGVKEALKLPVGSIIGVYYSFGPLAFLLNIVLFYKLIILLVPSLGSSFFTIKTFSIIIIYGALFSNFFFMWYGFNTAFGYVLLYLLANRLETVNNAFRGINLGPLTPNILLERI